MDIITKALRSCISKILRENSKNIPNATKDEMSDMMEVMDANLEEQEEPKVGIFWYSPTINDVFGVIAIDTSVMAQAEKRNIVSCKELHKNVWKKKFNYYKYHGGSNLYNGDYKYTPRGRVFYHKDTDSYDIMVGSWIHTFPNAEQKIKEAFDLTNPKLNVTLKIGEHWEIGMGYGD